MIKTKYFNFYGKNKPLSINNKEDFFFENPITKYI